MKLELDVPKGQETAIQNFYRNSKYLILLSAEGYSKVLVIK